MIARRSVTLGFLAVCLAALSLHPGDGAYAAPAADTPTARVHWAIDAGGGGGGDPEAVARSVLAKQADALGLAAVLDGLEFVSARESLLAHHVRFRQTVGGVPAADGEVVVSLSKRDDSARVFDSTRPVAGDPPARQPRIASDGALDAAWARLRVHGALLTVPHAALVQVPDGSSWRLAYAVDIGSTAPRGDWRCFVDAVSGEVFSVLDRRISKIPRAETTREALNDLFASYKGPVADRLEATAAVESALATRDSEPPVEIFATGSAKVFDPDPKTTLMSDSLLDGSAAASFTTAYVTRPLPGITYSAGTYSLVGPYVRIVDWDVPTAAPSTSASGAWTQTRGNNAFNDAMTYYHIDANQRYIQALGFTGPTAIQSGSIEADSHGEDGDDNSAFYPGSNRLSFGHGGVDDNEDVDVILHEYWHALHHGINPSWSGGDTGAIGEGLGDYWAASYSCSTSNGPAFHPTWAFTWDGHNGFWDGRDMDQLGARYNPARSYPAHTMVDGYNGDELWGTPIFQAFLELVSAGVPREEVDTLVVEAQFGLGAGVSMRTMAQTIVQTARELYPNGPHAGVFANKFAHHNLLDSSLYVSAPQITAEPVSTPGTSNSLSWAGGSIPAAKQAPMTPAPELTVDAHMVKPAGAATQRQDLPLAAEAKTAPAAPRSGVIAASDGPITTFAWQPVKTDGFETTWPGEWQTWGNYTAEGTPITWGWTTYVKRTGSYSVGSQCAVIDPEVSWPYPAQAGSPDISCWMWYGPFSLSDATAARVVFHTLHDLGSGDTLSWLASIDDVDYYGTTMTGGSSGGAWTQRTFDLTTVPTIGNLAGQSTVYIAFKATWDSTDNEVDGPFIDDVTIEKFTSSEIADLTVQSITPPAQATPEFYMATVSAQNRNAGAAVGGASHAALYVSPGNDSDTSDDAYAGEASVAALAAGATNTALWTFRMPNLLSGNYPVWFVVKADSREAVAESNEANNIYKHTSSSSVNGAVVLYNCFGDDDPNFGSPVPSGWVSQQGFQFTGLDHGRTYWYRVKAGAGPAGNMVESEWSAAASSTQDLPMGTPVWWMARYGLTGGSLTEQELADRDGDGMSAWEEFVAFTDPTNKLSALVLSDSAAAGGDRIIWWSSVDGPLYSVLRGAAPGGPFDPVATGVPPTPPMNVWTDKTSVTDSEFYRILVE